MRRKLNAIVCAVFVTAAVSVSAMEGDPTFGEERTLAASDDGLMLAQWRPGAAFKKPPPPRAGKPPPPRLWKPLEDAVRWLIKEVTYLQEQQSKEKAAAMKSEGEPSSPLVVAPAAGILRAPERW